MYKVIQSSEGMKKELHLLNGAKGNYPFINEEVVCAYPKLRSV